MAKLIMLPLRRRQQSLPKKYYKITYYSASYYYDYSRIYVDLIDNGSSRRIATYYPDSSQHWFVYGYVNGKQLFTMIQQGDSAYSWDKVITCPYWTSAPTSMSVKLQNKNYGYVNFVRRPESPAYSDVMFVPYDV